MNVRNAQLLASQEALQELSQARLRGVYALQLKEIMSAVQGRLEQLQGVQRELRKAQMNGEVTEDEADAEWAEVLEQELEIDEQPLSKEAFEDIEISAQTLMTIDWLIADEDSEDEQQPA